jgi:shikimate kinase / 3-dehydroquinate synthase
MNLPLRPEMRGMNQSMAPNPFIFLYGPPASGKSSLGIGLAESLQRPFYDLDEMIEARAGDSIPQIFASEGEAGFRQRENAMLEEVLNCTPGVVALGGGALLRLENRTLAEQAGQVLCLAAPFATIIARLGGTQGQRPLLDGDTRTRLLSLLEQRSSHYASFPLRIETGDLSLEEAIWQAQMRLGLFHVSGMGLGYDVRVASGGLDTIGATMRTYHLNGPLALVSDTNVSNLYADRVMGTLLQAGYAAHLAVIPAGEQNKNLASVVQLWDDFLAGSLERGSTVLALGGGVVGDLAGFAASVFLRGVHWAAAPTSLLAMVDASLGGKTGADLPQGKNLIGAFHPPSLVLADPQVLASLPLIELRNGLAEVVKHGVLADPVLFELCSRGWETVQENLDEIVRRAIAVKIRVIQEDPYERGRRASLNFGHTLGHAIESASDYRIKHGEAVAIGMVYAARISEQLGLASTGLVEAIRASLRGLDLPTDLPPGLDRQRILNGIGVDKKRSAGKVRWVLPVRIGEVRWGIEVDDSVAQNWNA